MAKKPNKIPVTSTVVKIRSYEIISRAIDDGIAYGWNRAHKHTDTPTPENVKDQIHQAIMVSLDEVLIFDE